MTRSMKVTSLAASRARILVVAVSVVVTVTSCSSLSTARSTLAPTAIAPAPVATVPAERPATPAIIPSPTPVASPTPLPPTATAIPTPTPVATLTPETSPAGQAVDLPNVDTHYSLDITSLNLGGGTANVDERVDVVSHQGMIPRLYFTVTTAKWGYFTLDSARIDGTAVTPASLNGGFTMAIDPPTGDHWSIEFIYHLALTQVPRDWYGSGLDGNIVRLGYWFPMLSTDFPYPSTADPAYSRVASFDVSLPLPNHMPFVSTGVEVGQDVIDTDHLRVHLHADNVRDFAMVIAPGAHIDEVETTNGITIRLLSYADSTAASRTTQLAAAKKAIETLSRLIGPYPYPVFSMADAGPSLPGGIEFPMLIDLNPAITPLDRLVYHETAHQWLYGIIGTRPQQDIWIDEGGAQFLEGFLDTGSALPDAPSGGYPYPLDSSDSELPQGPGIPGYQSIYYQGQRFYQAVLDTMGSDVFWAAMQQLYQQHKFGIVSPWDVLSTWQAHSPTDLRPLFRSTFRYVWIDRLPGPGG